MGYNIFTVIDEDPAIEPTYVPSRADYLGGREDAVRNMRIYMPRTYRKLIDDYDIILMSDSDRSVFETRWVIWLADSVPQGGMGMFWLGNIADARFETWEDTNVAGVLPVKQVEAQFGNKYITSGVLWLTVTDEDEPIMESLPWSQAPPVDNINLQQAKKGGMYGPGWTGQRPIH